MRKNDWVVLAIFVATALLAIIGFVAVTWFQAWLQAVL